MRFESDAEVWALVERLERCELEAGEFNHAMHLAVGMAYLVTTGAVDAALERMRVALLRYIAHLGKSGYHETMTRFWLLRLEEVRKAHALEPLPRLCNAAVTELADKDMIFGYYDRALLLSAAARDGWVEPCRYPIVVRGQAGRM